MSVLTRAVCSSLLVVLVSGTQVACAAGQKLAPMDPSRPIETEHGLRQNGQSIDPTSMSKALRNEPASASHASRAQVLETISLVAAGLGGGLIGWAVGEKLSGNPNPHWGLAYAGAGAVLVAFPLGLWSGSETQRAIEAHNQALAGEKPNP